MTIQVIEISTAVENKPESDWALQWAMAEVDLFANRLGEAASDLYGELDRAFGDFSDRNIYTAADDAGRRISILAGYIEREVNCFRAAVKESTSAPA
jgi:hypothetical protein